MDVWPRCLERLEAEFPLEDVHTWLKPLQAARRDDMTVLYAPNAFVRDEVRSRYLARIRELLAHFAGNGEVSLEIGSLPRAAPETMADTPISVVPPQAPSEPFAGNLDLAEQIRDATLVRAWRRSSPGLASRSRCAASAGRPRRNASCTASGTCSLEEEVVVADICSLPVQFPGG